MTQLRARAIWNLIIWVAALIGTAVTFFDGGGPSTFLEREGRVTLTRVLVTAAFVLHFVMMYLTRGRTAGRISKVRDERDEQIERRSLTMGFYLLAAYVFLCALALHWFYKVHREAVLMPVGWIWFLGISSFFTAMIVRALVVLVLDLSMSGHAQG